MKKIFALLLAAILICSFAACGEDSVSVASTPTTNGFSSEDANSIVITPSVNTSADNITAHDPNNSEVHTLTDEGNEVDRTTNQKLDASEFVQGTFAVVLAVSQGKLNTEIKTDSLPMEYYCRAVQVQKAMNSDAILTKDEFNKVVYDSFGVHPDAEIYQISGITSYADGSYTVKEFGLNMMWALGFDKAEVLGNGYVRYTGDLSYSHDGSEKNEKNYKVTCLLKHTRESSKGFQLISFKVTR